MPIRGWALFAALSLLWGVIYLLLKVLGDDIAPATLTFLRCVLAAALLFPLALRAGTLPSLRVHWRALLTMALLGVVIPFVSLAAGVNHVTSGLASILGATTPILIVLLAIPFDRSERVGLVQALGLLVGISGIVLLFGGGVAGDGDAVLGAALVLFASLVYAGATLYYKHAFHDLHPVGLMSWVFLLSAVLLAVPAALDPPARVPHADELASIVALGVFCSGAVYVLYFELVDLAGAGRASVSLYVSPAIAVVLGAIALGEELTATSVAGLLLVVIGARLSTGGVVSEPAV